MSNEIQSKFGGITALSITLANLASSTSGAGRQSAMVNNGTSRYGLLHLFVKVKLGANPTANKTVQVYFLKGNDGGLRTDSAGIGDAALTVKNAPLAGVLTTGNSPASGDVLQRHFLFHDPGPEWGIAIVHDTGVNLDSTAGNHAVHYIGDNPEVQ
jgi:hypothetical protein